MSGCNCLYFKDLHEIALDKWLCMSYTISTMIKQPMLAGKFDKDPLKAIEQMKALAYPVYGSPKLDGIRAHIFGRKVYSRKNKLIPNRHVQDLFGGLNLASMDGELIVGDPTSKTCFGTTSSGVMSEAGNPSVGYHVFDYTDITGNMPFVDRYHFAKAVLDDSGNPYVHLVPQVLISSFEELNSYEEIQVLLGYEGIMIRAINSPYKQGRSTLREGWLLKVKRFQDSEAIILGCYEQETNYNEAVINEVGKSKRSSHKENKIGNGHLGGFHVRDIHTNVEFDVGNFDGVTKEQRKKWWEKEQSIFTFEGCIIKYKFFPVGVKDKPRHPTFLGFRSPIDM